MEPVIRNRQEAVHAVETSRIDWGTIFIAGGGLSLVACLVVITAVSLLGRLIF